MKKTLLEKIVSFLLGVFWALLIVSALFLFNLFYPFGIFPVILSILLSSSFWLILIVLLEVVNLEIEKLKELKKHTELLESIEKRLYE